VERGADDTRVLCWYHRQFIEAARERYCSDPNQNQVMHANLADFFNGTWANGTLLLIKNKQLFYCYVRNVCVYMEFPTAIRFDIWFFLQEERSPTVMLRANRSRKTVLCRHSPSTLVTMVTTCAPLTTCPTTAPMPTSSTCSTNSACSTSASPSPSSRLCLSSEFESYIILQA